MAEEPTNAVPSWDVFIAYPSGHWKEANELFEALHPHVSVFLDKRSLQPGTPFDLAIPEAQRSSRMTAVIVDESYLTAFYTRAEAAAAIALSRATCGVHIVVPIYLNGLPSAYEAPYGFQLLQSLDLRKELSWGAISLSLRQMLLASNGVHNGPHELREQTQDDPKVALISRLPIGPRFEMFRIRPSIVREYASATKGDAAAGIVNEAAFLQISANPQATYILPYHLPDPHDVPSYTYWNDAFAEACLHGPRMVAALLLALDDSLFPEAVKQERQRLLQTLAAWK